jgi:hypothetical protein
MTTETKTRPSNQDCLRNTNRPNCSSSTNVTETVMLTVNKQVTEMETREYTVNKVECVTETKTRDVIHVMVTTTFHQDCSYDVTVRHRQEDKTRTTTSRFTKTFKETKTRTYNVCVPYTEQEEVDVTVCKMVPRPCNRSSRTALLLFPLAAVQLPRWLRMCSTCSSCKRLRMQLVF